MDAQFLALSDDTVHVLKAQVQAVAVLGSPAAFAVQVAGGGGVKQQDPRHVAIVLFAQFHDVVITSEHTLVHQVQGVHFQDVGVDLINGAVGILHPLAVGVGYESTDGVPVGVGITFCQQGLCQVDQLNSLLGHIFRALATDGVDGSVDGNAERCTLCRMDHFIHCHNRLLLLTLDCATILCLFSCYCAWANAVFCAIESGGHAQKSAKLNKFEKMS